MGPPATRAMSVRQVAGGVGVAATPVSAVSTASAATIARRERVSVSTISTAGCAPERVSRDQGPGLAYSRSIQRRRVAL